MAGLRATLCHQILVSSSRSVACRRHVSAYCFSLLRHGASRGPCALVAVVIRSRSRCRCGSCSCICSRFRSFCCRRCGSASPLRCTARRPAACTSLSQVGNGGWSCLYGAGAWCNALTTGSCLPLATSLACTGTWQEGPFQHGLLLHASPLALSTFTVSPCSPREAGNYRFI